MTTRDEEIVASALLGVAWLGWVANRLRGTPTGDALALSLPAEVLDFWRDVELYCLAEDVGVER